MNNSKKVCDIVFTLCKICPKNMHLIMTANHVNCYRLLDKSLRIQTLRLVDEHVSTFELFHAERREAVKLTDRNENDFDTEATLESLKAVYFAKQQTCKKILIFLLEHRVANSKQLILFQLLILFNFSQKFILFIGHKYSLTI